MSPSWKATFAAGAAAGVLDFAFACVYSWALGGTARGVALSVASGLLGREARAGGPAIVALGVALHFLIATTAAGVFVLAARRLRLLTGRPVLAGLLYGAAVYFFMAFVVVPLSAAPQGSPTLLRRAVMLAGHLVFVGLPISLVARRILRRAGSGT
jgi:hypothetical protein